MRWDVVDEDITNDTRDSDAGGLERRAFLQRAAVVAGATVWATPTVQSLVTPAFASGTGVCPPGRLVRFKFDVEEGRFDSGDASGNGAEWCLPEEYGETDLYVDANGCIVVDGQTKCVTVTLSADQMTATVQVPDGSTIEDLHAKAGNWTNGECAEVDPDGATTGTVSLDTKTISFVAGVICV